jgi:peroxiredoxin
MSWPQRILLISIAVLAGLGGSLAYHFLSQPQPPSAEETMASLRQEAPDLVGQQRPDYRLGDSEGQWVTAADFDGNIVLMNFWATWCQPCREEMPMLAELHQELADAGLEVVGIALDDVAQARAFADELGIAYPILVGSTDVMEVAQLYGNRSGVLPYSVLLDREGKIRWTYLGELKEATLREEISGLIAETAAQGSSP